MAAHTFIRRALVPIGVALALAVLAPAVAQGATFTVSPATFTKGATMTVSGAGWRPHRVVTLRTVRPGDTSGRWYDALRYRADRRGAFRARVRVNIEAGRYRMTASGPGRRAVRAWFTVTAAAPVSALRAIGAPVITGRAKVGAALTATTGEWVDAAGASFAHTWYRCDAAGQNCTAVAGATGATYTLAQADLGATVRVQVTASRGGETVPGPASDPTPVVTRDTGATTTPQPPPPPPASGPCPAPLVENPLMPGACCDCTRAYGAENPGCALACHTPAEHGTSCRRAA